MTAAIGDAAFPRDVFANPYKSCGPFANVIMITSSLVHEAKHNEAGTWTNQDDACNVAGDFLEFWIPRLKLSQDKTKLENRLSWIRNGTCGKTQ